MTFRDPQIEGPNILLLQMLSSFSSALSTTKIFQANDLSHLLKRFAYVTKVKNRKNHVPPSAANRSQLMARAMGREGSEERLLWFKLLFPVALSNCHRPATYLTLQQQIPSKGQKGLRGQLHGVKFLCLCVCAENSVCVCVKVFVILVALG